MNISSILCRKLWGASLFIYFNWRIALNSALLLPCTNMNQCEYTYVPSPSPNLPLTSIIYPLIGIWNTRFGSHILQQFHWLPLHMVMYTFQCYSLSSSYPTSPVSTKSVLSLIGSIAKIVLSSIQLFVFSTLQVLCCQIVISEVALS